MYAANVALSGPIGLLTLLAPATMRELTGLPAGDPVSLGIASGAVPLAFGLAGIAGLRSPRRFAPVLALQVVYKLLFLVGVVVPLALSGGVPAYAWPLVGVFVFFVVGNSVAVPWSQLLSSEPAT